MAEEQIQVIIAGSTDTGLRRSHNQDFIGFNQELGIAVLADGMGGHQAGEIAAQLAVESVLGTLQGLGDRETVGAITSSQLLHIVSNTISDSNSKIFEASEANEEHKGMGTTVVAAVVKGAHVYAGHVGDSRLYLYRDQVLRRITKDHSLAQDLIDKGFYTEAEARSANVSHVVTRALGTRADVEVDTIKAELEFGDILLLCSDGLTDMISDWQIAEVIDNHRGDLDMASEQLIDLANKYGGKDNISVILIQILGHSVASAQSE